MKTYAWKFYPVQNILAYLTFNQVKKDAIIISTLIKYILNCTDTDHRQILVGR